IAALPPKTTPNLRTIDVSKVVLEVTLLSDYQNKPKDAETRYSGQQHLIWISFPEMRRAADGTACVLGGTNQGQYCPSVVVRLATESGWRAGARPLKDQLYIEGRVVGTRAPADPPWMRDWAQLPQGGVHIPGKVIVVEGAKIVTPP